MVLLHIISQHLRANVWLTRSFDAAFRFVQIHASGPSDDLGGATVIVEGGIIATNLAIEHGGAISVWGYPTEVLVKGGTFRNNTAL